MALGNAPGMIYRLAFCVFCLPLALTGRPTAVFETSDIGRFWAAFDRLPDAQTLDDSIAILQRMYIDEATEPFKAFIRARAFTAGEYVRVIRTAPKFWASIRPVTERIAGRQAEIEALFDTMATILPGFRRPDVCFAIGCLRTGGTTSKSMILVGAEIAAADNTVDKSELNGWLRSILGQTGDIVAMVAHEAVHTNSGVSRSMNSSACSSTSGLACSTSPLGKAARISSPNASLASTSTPPCTPMVRRITTPSGARLPNRSRPTALPMGTGCMAGAERPDARRIWAIISAAASARHTMTKPRTRRAPSRPCCAGASTRRSTGTADTPISAVHRALDGNPRTCIREGTEALPPTCSRTAANVALARPRTHFG